MKKSQTIEAELQRIAAAHGGHLKPVDVVEEARKSASPLHSHFEWDDTEAAQNWRLQQARMLIRVAVRYIGSGKTKRLDRVFVSLRQERTRGGDGYRTMIAVLSNRKLRMQLLEDALAEMQTFQEKYSKLKELAGVFSAMKEVQTKAHKRGRKAA